ncbi:hypothetical protein WMF31_26530 [Sorangium sp. So ce1036]|uniref:hypothetical protein n=1 Tax=Sorangium sp. So ce1036 TaxID=3133328 RepID=UPI003F109E19
MSDISHPPLPSGNGTGAVDAPPARDPAAPASEPRPSTSSAPGADDVAQLADRCHAAALRAADWIEGQLQPDGSFGPDITDLAAYYKAPSLMHLIGRPRAAHRLLDHIAAAFGDPSGDFNTAPGVKTADPVLSQYPGYLNGWILLGAHRAGRFDVSLRAWKYLRGFQHPRLGAALLDGPGSGGKQGQVEMLMTAHLGLAALHLGDLRAARAAGKALLDFHDLQPDVEERLYLRRSKGGDLVTSYPPEQAALHVVEARRPGQAWFFVGYPIAFLTQLYRATGRRRYLRGARRYVKFARRCGALPSEHFGHKVGWGSALFARASGSPGARRLAAAVATNLLAAQAADGGWLPDAPLVNRLDQSAEVAQWLLEIAWLLR